MKLFKEDEMKGLDINAALTEYEKLLADFRYHLFAEGRDYNAAKADEAESRLLEFLSQFSTEEKAILVGVRNRSQSELQETTEGDKRG
jgi:hypothetical protein